MSSFDPAISGQRFLPAMPMTDGPEQVSDSRLSGAVRDVVSDYNKASEAVLNRWIDVITSEKQSPADFIRLRLEMQNVSLYDQAGKLIQSSVSDLLNNLIVRG